MTDQPSIRQPQLTRAPTDRIAKAVWAAGDGASLAGLHRATVVSTDDLQGQQRIQVSVPAVSANALWALCSVPLRAEAIVELEVGATVWVMFEAGQQDRPVVIGRLPE